MAKEALPCIVCRRELNNVFEDLSNQPYDGVACFTGGNYGSRVFDSFDGQKLEFNVCDECLVKAGEDGLILTGRFKRPVRLAKWGYVGGEDVVYEPVPWTADHPGFDSDDVFELDVDNMDDLPEEVELHFPKAQLISMAKDDGKYESDEDE